MDAKSCVEGTCATVSEKSAACLQFCKCVHQSYQHVANMQAWLRSHMPAPPRVRLQVTALSRSRPAPMPPLLTPAAPRAQQAPAMPTAALCRAPPTSPLGPPPHSPHTIQ